MQHSGGADHGRRPPLPTNSSGRKHKSSSGPGLAQTAPIGQQRPRTFRPPPRLAHAAVVAPIAESRADTVVCRIRRLSRHGSRDAVSRWRDARPAGIGRAHLLSSRLPIHVARVLDPASLQGCDESVGDRRLGSPQARRAVQCAAAHRAPPPAAAWRVRSPGQGRSVSERESSRSPDPRSPPLWKDADE